MFQLQASHSTFLKSVCSEGRNVPQQVHLPVFASFPIPFPRTRTGKRDQCGHVKAVFPAQCNTTKSRGSAALPHEHFITFSLLRPSPRQSQDKSLGVSGFMSTKAIFVLQISQYHAHIVCASPAVATSPKKVHERVSLSCIIGGTVVGKVVDKRVHCSRVVHTTAHERQLGNTGGKCSSLRY